MMFPRLKLSREFLKDDGVIVISISDAEMANLVCVMNDIYGTENFLATVCWHSTRSVTNTALISVSHTYNIIYAKNKEYFTKNRSHFRLSETGEGFSNPDNDPRGPWKSDPFQVGGERPNQQYEIENPVTGKIYRPLPGNSWKNEEKVFLKLLDDNRIVFGSSGVAGPGRKRFLSEALNRGKVATTWWDVVDTTTNATDSAKRLFDGDKIFDNPKPVSLIEKFIELGVHDPNDAIIMDFFAGLGTTGHAVMAANAKDGKNRRYVLVQLPEPLNQHGDNSQRSAKKFCQELDVPQNIAELTKERLRRAGHLILEQNPNYDGDIGFRVYKLNSSNFRSWHPRPTDLQRALIDSIEKVSENRGDLDILSEVILVKGFDLCTPVDFQKIGGNTLYLINSDDRFCFVCVDTHIKTANVQLIVQGIANCYKHKTESVDASIVFRDSAFENDVGKTNFVKMLEQNGLRDVTCL